MGHNMHTTTILTILIAFSANAYPSLLQSYGLPQTGGNNQPIRNPTGSSSTTQSIGGSAVLGTSSGQVCTGEQVHNALGECVLPEISRNIYVYTAPSVISNPGPAPTIPKPEVHYNLVFVKTSDLAQQNQPIIVPPPQQKTLVYVLSKKQQGGNNVIQAPYNPTPNPEVFYVNYGQGDNPLLPGGVDLQTALSSAFTQGQNLNSQLQPSDGSHNQGTNVFGTSQNQGSGHNQGNKFVGNIIDGPTISGGIVNSPGNIQPINGGIINGGIVDGGIIDPGFGGGISLGQSQVDSGFGQSGFGQGGLSQGSFGQVGSSQGSFGQAGSGQGSFGQDQSVVINNPSVGQGGQVDIGFGDNIITGEQQVDSGFGQGNFVQGGSGQQTTVINNPGIFGPQSPGGVPLGQSGGNIGQVGIVSNPAISQSTGQGYQYPTPSNPLNPQQGGQATLSQGSFNPSPSVPSPPPPPPPPSRPTQLYGTPN